MSVTEVYQALCHFKQSGTGGGLDGIDGEILKVSAPVIAETLTFVIYALTNRISPFSLSNPGSFLYSSLVIHFSHQIIGQSLFFQFYLNPWKNISTSIFRNILIFFFFFFF